MHYIKILLSSMLAMIIAAIVIWSGLFIILFSLIATPLIAWWLKKRSTITKTKANTGERTTGDEPASYKVIEAKYEIIEK